MMRHVVKSPKALGVGGVVCLCGLAAAIWAPGGIAGGGSETDPVWQGQRPSDVVARVPQSSINGIEQSDILILRQPGAFEPGTQQTRYSSSAACHLRTSPLAD